MTNLYAVKGKTEFAINTVNDYLCGNTDTIYELELETYDDDMLLLSQLPQKFMNV